MDENEPYVEKMTGWPLIAVWTGCGIFCGAAWTGIYFMGRHFFG